MNKKVKYSFGGINQDTSRSKHSYQKYYEGQHIRILSTDTQSTGSVTNEKGNELVISIPNVTINIISNTITVGTSTSTSEKIIFFNNDEIPQQVNNGLLPTSSENQRIIGTIDNRSGIIIFTTDDAGMDCIWLVDNVLGDEYTIDLLYVRNLNFSTSAPIQALFNYENEKIEKVYWVDGVNQIRFLNIRHSIDNGDVEELIDINSNTINFVGNFDLNEPVVTDVVYGGNHTSGVIQYAYNLYRINGSQTTISPISEMIPLDKGDSLGGGELNEVIGATPVVSISDIDPEYTHIKIYAIKYTSFNQEPSISLIEDREIGSTNSVVYFDDGAVMEQLTLEEFIFLGSNPIIPRHIESKDNRLFSANITENNFDVDLDCRAYSFLEGTDTAWILNNVQPDPGVLPIPMAIPGVGGEPLQVNSDFDVPEDHDAVNPNYAFYKWQKNSNTVLGGTGKYIQYSINPTVVDNIPEKRVFKDREVYRIGIQFYNRLGQISFPKWIADFQTGFFNYTNLLNTLTIELTAEFYVWLNDSSNFESEDDKPVGYKVIRADRTLNDRTILYQGALTPMMFQVKGAEAQDYTQFYNQSAREDFQDDESLKMPSWAARNFATTMNLKPDFLSGGNAVNGRILGANHLAWLNDAQNINNASSTDGGEIHTKTDSNDKIAQTFLFTKMMQLHSPDILFDFANVKNGLELRVVGLMERTSEYIETQETEIATEQEKNGGTFQFYPTRLIEDDNNLESTFSTPGGRNPRYIGPSGDEGTTDIFQMFRGYDIFIPNTGLLTYEIYGIPEVSQEGQSAVNYNGDARYQYSNNLSSFASDGAVGGSEDCDECQPLVSINSNGVKCLTLMLGDANNTTAQRKGLEDLYNESLIGSIDGQGILIVEIIIPNENIYLGNLYGGNTFEDKKRNTYIQIGNYQDINTATNYIDSPGDTFINDFQFLRIGKTSIDSLNSQVPQISEILKFPIETTVDLKNRNDLSLFEWDNTFQPEFEEYHKYNRVYSQSPNLILNTGEGAIFKEVSQFDTRVYTSKLKIPGEVIDNWTDLLINESQDLDGKYGPINGLVNFKDNLYTFQDEAIAALSINPRVQVQGSDGVSVELGTGSIFYDYNYVTTTSGSINKWGILPTKKGIYYYDALNKAVGRLPGFTDNFLSDVKGMHTFFNNNYNYDNIKVDNPIIGSGVVFGYDNFNNDVYFTVLQDEEDTHDEDKISFTRVYNELVEEFIDRKLYIPTNYIYKGEKLLVSNPDNDKIYEQFAGQYNRFFDEYHPSFIVLMVNPDSDIDCVFDTIQYTSELYLDDIDQPDKTLTHIQAWSEYQDSGRIPLILGRNKNLRRKFREWKATIPRQNRDRIRNPWIFLKLELDNKSNKKLILHDIIVNYTV